MKIDVKGHSGCPIDIVRENNALFIYKSTYDKKYLERLAKQAEKQQEAWHREYHHVRIPEIFNVARDDNHVTIKMEYVYSRNFIEYFESAGFEQVDYFVKALILFIEKELDASPLQLVNTSITLDKFDDVKKKIAENTLLSDDKEIEQLIIESQKRFDSFGDHRSIRIPLGLCHGDLTFSNILFNGNNYYLIDFLDSFIESPLLDVVKIRQDSAHLWSQLMYVKPYDKLRLKIICEKIDYEIDSYFRKYEWYREYYDIYQLMNLLRILQYAKEDNVINYLKCEIGKMLSNRQGEVIEKTIVSNAEPSNKFSLIVPAAADTDDDSLPYVFNLNEKGIMLCVDAIMGLNIDIFDDIYFTILRKHVDKFSIDEMLKLQFRRFGLENVHIVVLDTPTISQTETLYRTIKQAGIEGGIFIKDADGYYKAEIKCENTVAIFQLEQMEIVDPQHKSYVSVDDMYYITNMIEKRIISHSFNAGGSCFVNSELFCNYYEKLKVKSQKVYVSHIIYQMLLDRYQFRPVEVYNYVDWGTQGLYKYYLRNK